MILSMNKDGFEAAVLKLWVTTNIPLTKANVQYHTGLPRRKVKAWMNALVADGVLDIDSDGDSTLIFSVPGARRKPDGPRTFDDVERANKSTGAKKKNRWFGRSSDDDDEQPSFDAGTALAIAGSARRELDRGPDDGKKSLLMSGGLSLFLGPLGWLYAGSLREAIPASAAYLAAATVIPNVLLLPMAGILLPISGVAGLVYAWQYNRKGKRTRILGDGDKPKK